MAEQINKCVSGRRQCQRKTVIHHPVCERQRGEGGRKGGFIGQLCVVF